jgi:hypothetical protein
LGSRRAGCRFESSAFPDPLAIVAHELRFAAENRRGKEFELDLADHVFGPAFERIEALAHGQQGLEDTRTLGPRYPRFEAFLRPFDHNFAELPLPPLFAAQPGVLT